MIVLYVLGYFIRNKQNSYAALIYDVIMIICFPLSKEHCLLCLQFKRNNKIVFRSEILHTSFTKLFRIKKTQSSALNLFIFQIKNIANMIIL